MLTGAIIGAGTWVTGVFFVGITSKSGWKGFKPLVCLGNGAIWTGLWAFWGWVGSTVL